MNRFLAFALAAALPVVALAQTYKWVDQNGQTHYTQVPPKTGKYDVIGAAPPPAAAPNQDALNQSLQQSIKSAPAREEAAAQVAQQQAKKQEACRQALEQIAYLDAKTPRRLASKDESGNVTRMSDEEFQRRRAAEQKKADENCG